MLDSLRYLRTFPTRKDRRFSTSFAYTRSTSPELHVYLAALYMDVCRHIAACGIGCR